LFPKARKAKENEMVKDKKKEKLQRWGGPLGQKKSFVWGLVVHWKWQTTRELLHPLIITRTTQERDKEREGKEILKGKRRFPQQSNHKQVKTGGGGETPKKRGAQLNKQKKKSRILQKNDQGVLSINGENEEGEKSKNHKTTYRYGEEEGRKTKKNWGYKEKKIEREPRKPSESKPAQRYTCRGHKNWGLWRIQKNEIRRGGTGTKRSGQKSTDYKLHPVLGVRRTGGQRKKNGGTFRGEGGSILNAKGGDAAPNISATARSTKGKWGKQNAKDLCHKRDPVGKCNWERKNE